MNLRFGDRIRGADGTYRKVISMEGDHVTVQIGLSMERRTILRNSLEGWAAEPTPGKPQPSDYEKAEETITIKPVEETSA